MAEIERGALLHGEGGDGRGRELRALGGVTAGGDFAVVWVCSPAEWEAAQRESREAAGIPWPEESLQLVEPG